MYKIVELKMIIHRSNYFFNYETASKKIYIIISLYMCYQSSRNNSTQLDNSYGSHMYWDKWKPSPLNSSS